MAGVNMIHVPYRGEAPALADMLGGQVQVIFSTMPGTLEYIMSGRLRPLAVTTATRSETLPNIPTVGGFLPRYDAVGWHGVGVPKHTPTEIIDKLNKEINAGLADPKLKARFADLGAAVFPGSPARKHFSLPPACAVPAIGQHGQPVAVTCGGPECRKSHGLPNPQGLSRSGLSGNGLS
jgi:tripartite-type tricarboxylate transporter receptor subunit TctC